MRNIDYRASEGNISNINYLGSFRAEKKLDVKEKCFIETKDPVIAVETRVAVTVPLKKTTDVYRLCNWLCEWNK